MTPCPESGCGPPICTGGCPPNQVCLRIAEGYEDGYCTWGPPANNEQNVNACETEDSACCCHCAPANQQFECQFTILLQEDDQEGCTIAQSHCTGPNTRSQFNASTGCCQMVQPEDGSAILHRCNLYGAKCIPCNKEPQVRPFPNPNPNVPYPYSAFFPPCYNASPNQFNRAYPGDSFGYLDYSQWENVFFNILDNHCAYQDQCEGSCTVYSQCNENPEIYTDGCQLTGVHGAFCYLPSVPQTCAQPTEEGSCDTSACYCPPGTTPYSTLQSEYCPGIGYIYGCTFDCIGDPCQGENPPPECQCLNNPCPPGFICVPNPSGIPDCVPL